MRRSYFAALGALSLSCGVGDLAAAAVTVPHQELVYAPIPPCRIFNTSKPGAGGRIAANKSRDFLVAGTAGFDSQGGTHNGCGVPAWATAVSLSLTASQETAPGHLASYATGTTRPTTATLSYRANATETSGTIEAINSGKLSVFATSATNVAGDITGYFAPAIEGRFNLNGVALSSTARVIGEARLNVGEYQIKIDRDVTYCVPTASTGGGPYFASAYGSGVYVYVETFDASGTHVDLTWQLSVTC